MKTYITTFILAVLAICRADGTMILRAGGHFLNGTWASNDSYINGIPSGGTTLDATLTATPERGYKVAGWYYYHSNSSSTLLSDWTQLSDEGVSHDTCTVKHQSPFSDGSNTYIALNLNYVSYGISFNYAGGTGGTSLMSGLVITNSVTLPVPDSRAGYTFVAWTNDVGDAFQAGVPLDTLAEDLGIGNVDTDFTLTAQWQAQTMFIEYNLEGGVEGDVYPESATFGEAFLVSAPTRTGYVFKGWEFANINTETARYGTTSNPDTRMSTGSAYPSGGGDIWLKNLSTTSSPAITMTATWEAKTYTVHLETSGVTQPYTDTLTVTYGKSLPNVKIIPVYSSGAEFYGFYTEPNGQGVQYWDNEGRSNSAIEVWTNDVDNMTFYAYKGGAQRVIRFNGNGGSPNQTTEKRVEGSAYGEMPAVSWAGNRYSFTGWFTEQVGGDEVLGTTLVPVGFGDINLYAHWAVSNYYVRFDGNGATGGAMDIQKIDFDDGVALSSNKYFKSGMHFEGWASAGSATADYADCAVVSNLSSTAGETNVLTAVWTTNTYYVVFDANGGTGTMATLTNLYGVAYEYPACSFTRKGFWSFSCWSNTVSGATAAPGDELLNLADKDGETVVIKAVWSTTLTKLSQAMHCDNLQWNNKDSGSGVLWFDEWGAGLGYNQSGSMASQANWSGRSLQASVETNGTFRFMCRMDSGEAGTLLVWTSEDSSAPYDSGLYQREIGIEASGSWQVVEFSVTYKGNPLYVNLANKTVNKKICIDHMEWIPEGSDEPVEPGAGDEREFSSLACSGDSLFLSFPNADERFSYVLRGTNDLVAPMPWPALFSTNGTGSITIETKILPGVPRMFYYLETTSK